MPFRAKNIRPSPRRCFRALDERRKKSSMRRLKDKLIEFADKDHSSVDKLSEAFAELAPYFLYGGYIQVLNRYHIYIQRVEFYFHSEREDGIKDPIVYHRDKYHIDAKLPYFTPITFHAHASGYDIAFENPDKEYRASVLIRAYEVFDEEQKEYLKVEKSRFVYTKVPFTNTQSTYLYDILNGFGDAGSILWTDSKSLLFDNHEELKVEKRKGVYLGEKWSEDIYAEPRERKWSFSRKEFIKIL